MKRNNIKNRKVEFRNKKFLVTAFVLGACLICASLGLSYWLFIYQRPYITPLPFETRIQSDINSSQSVNIESEIQQYLQNDKVIYDKIEKSGGTTYIISLDNNGEVIINGSGDISLQIASLQLIVNRLTMEGKRFSRLDLRYDKPVIVF